MTLRGEKGHSVVLPRVPREHSSTSGGKVTVCNSGEIRKKERTFTSQVNIWINKFVTSVGECLSKLGYFLPFFFFHLKTFLAKWAIIS